MSIDTWIIGKLSYWSRDYSYVPLRAAIQLAPVLHTQFHNNYSIVASESSLFTLGTYVDKKSLKLSSNQYSLPAQPSSSLSRSQTRRMFIWIFEMAYLVRISVNCSSCVLHPCSCVYNCKPQTYSTHYGNVRCQTFRNKMYFFWPRCVAFPAEAVLYAR